MDPLDATRRQAGLEIQQLAEAFERSDEAAFRRARIVCWVVAGAATLMVLVLLIMGGDGRYLGAFWVAVVGLTGAGYALFSRR